MSRHVVVRTTITVFLLALAGCAATPGAGGEPTLTGADARAVFERFKALEGEWKGTSTKGWTDILSYRTIAGGSAVMQTSFAAHEGETMVTMIHPDGERLLLTHYCAARNQPRLQASTAHGNEVVFAFLDGTNLPSRDAGHMDRVWIRFDDEDHFTERWTWYQDGQESWMEEIHNERVTAPAGGAAPDAGKDPVVPAAAGR